MKEKFAREKGEIVANLRKQEEALDRLAPVIVDCAAKIKESLSRGGKVLIFGNGGSAASAQHFAAELTGRYITEREPMAAIALSTDTSALTAIGNDYGFDEVFARQMKALARPGDVAVGFSTSGNSANVNKALEAAKNQGCTTLAILGRDGGKTLSLVDAAVVYDARQTPRIQEFHDVVCHIICALLE